MVGLCVLSLFDTSNLQPYLVTYATSHALRVLFQHHSRKLHSYSAKVRLLHPRFVSYEYIITFFEGFVNTFLKYFFRQGVDETIMKTEIHQKDLLSS